MYIKNHIDCAEDQFKCSDNHCIPENKVCDGVRDCLENEDEEDCHSNTGKVHKKCINKTKTKSFWNLTTLLIKN